MSKPSSRYLDFFVKNARALAPVMKLFPNAKEITESVGAFLAVSDYVTGPDGRGTPRDVIVVGDGTRPRTAAIFAALSVWNVYSVDPLMKMGMEYPARITAVASKIEDWEMPQFTEPVWVLVHAHVPLSAIPQGGALVAIPCCVKQEEWNGSPPDKQYQAESMLTPANTVRIWGASRVPCHEKEHGRRSG